MTLTEPSSVIVFPEDDLVDVAEGDARCTVVWLQGEYDISTVTALSQTMARTVANEGGDLVVDLSGVQFMDAATIGVLIRTRNEMRLQLRSLTLRSPSPFEQRILGLCGLTDLLDPPPADTGTTQRTSALDSLL